MKNGKIYTKDTRLSEVSMTTLALHSFLRAGFVTVGDVLAADIEKIYQIRGIGQLTVSRLQLELAEHGIKWNIDRLRTNKTVGNNVTVQTSLSDLGLDIRITNALETVDCTNVGQLIGLSYTELKSVRGISDKSIVYLKNMLANHNIIWNIVIEHDVSNSSILI